MTGEDRGADDRRRDLFNKRMAQALSNLMTELPGVIAELTLGDFDDEDYDALAQVFKVLLGRIEQRHSGPADDVGADGAR